MSGVCLRSHLQHLTRLPSHSSNTLPPQRKEEEAELTSWRPFGSYLIWKHETITHKFYEHTSAMLGKPVDGNSPSPWVQEMSYLYLGPIRGSETHLHY